MLSGLKSVSLQVESILKMSRILSVWYLLSELRERGSIINSAFTIKQHNLHLPCRCRLLHILSVKLLSQIGHFFLIRWLIIMSATLVTLFKTVKLQASWIYPSIFAIYLYSFNYLHRVKNKGYSDAIVCFESLILLSKCDRNLVTS